MRKSRDETVNAVNLNANGLAIDATHLSTLSTYPALQRDGGHYGVSLMVFDGEPFFGQDRFDQLVWRMTQKGLVRR